MGIRMSSDRICGAQNPRNTVVICTKPEGHEGKHGRRQVIQRSLFWGWELVAAGE
jgi:hypothetical protein